MPPTTELQWAVVVLTIVGTILTAWIRGWFSSAGSKPDTIESLGKRLDEAFERIDAQDDVIGELRDTVVVMRDQMYEDKQERHRLKGAIISLVGIARQLVRAVVEVFTDEQVDALPQPSRKHVRDGEDFEEYLQLARAREREA